MSDLAGPASVLGQETALRTFDAALRSDRVGAAYLLHGPPGVGRSVGARTFAAALLCERPLGLRACGSCGACHRVAGGVHPDLLWIAADSGPRFDDDTAAERAGIDQFTRAARLGAKPGPRKTIAVRVLRRLLELLSLASAAGGRKVAVLDAFDEIEEEGAATLLKVLEEPPPRTTFLLLAGGTEGVPDTILSRCQRVRFRPLAPDLVRRLLGHHAKEPLGRDETELLVRTSQGSAGRAIRAAAEGLHGEPLAAARALADGAGAEKSEATGPDAVVAWVGGAGRDLEAQRERVRSFVALALVLVRDRWHADRSPPVVAALRTVLEGVDANVSPELVVRALWARDAQARSLPV